VMVVVIMMIKMLIAARNTKPLTPQSYNPHRRCT
jgi:hypothetical protein